MGIGGISIWQLLIILVIVILLFGTKKLRGIGGDLGGAIKNFRSAMRDGEAEQKEQDDNDDKDKAVITNQKLAADKAATADEKVIEGQVTSKETGQQAK